MASGVPLLPIYQPPPPPVATLGLQQHQFPPPVPQSYLPRGLFPPFSKDNPPPPPSIYYSRYPSLPPVNYGPVMGVYGAPPGMVPVQTMGLTHGENYSAEFAQESVREAFVQKVLFLVFLQLLAMAGLSLLCLEVEYIKDEVVGSHQWNPSRTVSETPDGYLSFYNLVDRSCYLLDLDNYSVNLPFSAGDSHSVMDVDSVFSDI